MCRVLGASRHYRLPWLEGYGHGMSIAVLVVDGQALFAGALAGVLEDRFGFDVIDERPETAAEAIDAARRHRPDVVLLDAWLPDMQGPAATRVLKDRLPDCKVLMLAGFYSPQQIDDALGAGVVGYLPKSIAVDELADAIRQANAGTYPVDPEQLATLRRTLRHRSAVASEHAERLASLTQRELEVLRLLNQGRSTKEIAEHLWVSAKTAGNHIQRIFDKTNTSSRGEVLAIARETGFLHPPPLGRFGEG